MIEQLIASKHKLLLIKSQLYWYGGQGWDDTPGRVCIILDTCQSSDILQWYEAGKDDKIVAASASACTLSYRAGDSLKSDAWIKINLLIDGVPRWIQASKQDIEILDEHM